MVAIWKEVGFRKNQFEATWPSWPRLLSLYHHHSTVFDLHQVGIQTRMHLLQTYILWESILCDMPRLPSNHPSPLTSALQFQHNMYYDIDRLRQKQGKNNFVIVD